jgi:hypothetical protein
MFKEQARSMAPEKAERRSEELNLEREEHAESVGSAGNGVMWPITSQ